MRKGRSIIGLKVIGRIDGTDLGTVKDLVFDYESSEVLALLMSEKDLFGLVDARVIPWREVQDIGPDAVMVTNAEATIRAGIDPRIRDVLERETSLVGKTINTEDGRNLGAFTDIFLEDNGQIVGYEVSGGLFADALGGRQFMPVPSHFVIGSAVAVVPAEIARQMEAQRQTESGVKGAVAGVAGSVGGSVAGAYAAASQSIGDAYQNSRVRASELYNNIASQSVERQKEFVVGKVAAHEVIIPAAAATTAPEAVVPEAVEKGSPIDAVRISELGVPTPAVATDVDASGVVIEGEVLVRQGEIITRAHADRATETGVLAKLVLAASSGIAGETLEAGRERIAAATATAQQRALENAIGKPAARDVTDTDGSLIVATGMIVTPEIVERARLVGKENELVAVAGAGAASENVSRGVESVKAQAVNLWDTVRQKAAELTEVAQQKKNEYDEQTLQRRIDNAIGHPANRVVLDREDNIILNAGEVITHAAVERARGAGVIEMLLGSTYAEETIPQEEVAPENAGAAMNETASAPVAPVPIVTTPVVSAQTTEPTMAPIPIPEGEHTEEAHSTPLIVPVNLDESAAKTDLPEEQPAEEHEISKVALLDSAVQEPGPVDNVPDTDTSETASTKTASQPPTSADSSNEIFRQPPL